MVCQKHQRRPHPPRKTPRQTRSKHLVEAILEAAARVFDQHGFERGTTNRIAELAGVSVGSLYQYFPNKKALVTALHARHMQEVGQLIGQELRDGAAQPLAASIDRLVFSLLQIHHQNARLQRVLHMEMPFYRPDPVGEPLASTPAQELMAVLQAHRAELATPDLDQAAAMVLHMGEALVHAAVLNPPPGLGLPALAEGISQALQGYLLRPRVDAGARG